MLLGIALLLAFGFVYGMIKVCWTNIADENRQIKTAKEAREYFDSCTPERQAEIRREARKYLSQHPK